MQRRQHLHIIQLEVLLTITTSYRPATDLGYLLHKNPTRPQVFDLSFGKVHVFYTEASDEVCTAALMLDVDSVGLVRNRRGPAGEGFALEQYVNDRPYVASSFLSVAISQVFGSALSGTSRERPELTTTPIPLIARITVLPSSDRNSESGVCESLTHRTRLMIVVTLSRAECGSDSHPAFRTPHIHRP